MIFMNLNMLFDFIQVLYSIRKHSIKVGYFPKHILFIIIYLLQEQKLNYRNYSKQEIIMGNFVQVTEYDANMYARIEYFDIYRFL
jgi:hypothetical protein